MGQILQVAIGKHALAVVLLQFQQERPGIDPRHQRALFGQRGGQFIGLGVPAADTGEQQSHALNLASRPVHVEVLEATVRQHVRTGQRVAAQQGRENKRQNSHLPITPLTPPLTSAAMSANASTGLMPPSAQR